MTHNSSNAGAISCRGVWAGEKLFSDRVEMVVCGTGCETSGWSARGVIDTPCAGKRYRIEGRKGEDRDERRRERLVVREMRPL